VPAYATGELESARLGSEDGTSARSLPSRLPPLRVDSTDWPASRSPAVGASEHEALLRGADVASAGSLRRVVRSRLRDSGGLACQPQLAGASEGWRRGSESGRTPRCNALRMNGQILPSRTAPRLLRQCSGTVPSVLTLTVSLTVVSSTSTRRSKPGVEHPRAQPRSPFAQEAVIERRGL